MKLRKREKEKPKEKEQIIRWRSPYAFGDIVVKVVDLSQFKHPVISLNKYPEDEGDVYLESPRDVKKLIKFLREYIKEIEG